MKCETPPGGYEDMEAMRKAAGRLKDAQIEHILKHHAGYKDRLTPYLMRWCSALRREARRRGLGT